MANLASQTNQDTVRQRQDFIEENNEDQKFMLHRGLIEVIEYKHCRFESFSSVTNKLIDDPLSS